MSQALDRRKSWQWIWMYTLHCTTLHFSIVIKAKEQFQVYTRHRPQWWVGTWCKMPTPLYTVYCKPNDICKQGASKCQKIIIPWHQKFRISWFSCSAWLITGSRSRDGVYESTLSHSLHCDKLPVMILKMPMIVGNIPERKNAARCPMSSVMRENLTNRISLATSAASWLQILISISPF